MTDEQLLIIESRAGVLKTTVAYAGMWNLDTTAIAFIRDDVPALIDEARRLRASVAEFEQYEEIAKHNAAEQSAISEWRRAECVRLSAEIERIGRERDQMVAANVELQERANETHDALRTMGKSWLTLAVSLAADPRRQGESRILKDCADDLARTFDAANHPIKPEEDK